MQTDIKVFSSDITRSQNPLKNNLYDLINLVPARPISMNKVEKHVCEFQPKIDKHYTPKKKNRVKVKTVRDIRHLFEKDIYNHLPLELEKQQNILLRKIKDGSSNHESTRLLAKNLLESDKPICRSVWQMIMNINPEGHTYSIQYVLWNGKRIQINGSKGGKNKFICYYDLGSNELSLKNKSLSKKTLNKKKGLLKNSLSIKFKPGPLTKKKILDDSHQRYHIGNIELVNLPTPGLDIHLRYGVALEPTITHFLNNLRDVNGTISQKWAEFSVSMLGTKTNTDIIQSDEECCVTFDLNYKFDQHRILMRRDVDSAFDLRTGERNTFLQHSRERDESVISSEVKIILNLLLDSVEISFNQDHMYTGEDEPRSITHENALSYSNNQRDKAKRKYGELERLDVTVIRLSDTPQKDLSETCQNSYCALGCICASLQCGYHLKRHCGRVECMFECKCDFSKYKIIDSLESDSTELIPGLLNLDNEMNLKLSKEEKKFRQTVIMTGKKSILLKSHKRNWKASKKYTEFYSNMCLKTENKVKRVLSVVVSKLTCLNVEPWCMIHNLYKCFCQGKFIDSLIQDVNFIETNANNVVMKQEGIEAIKQINNDKRNIQDVLNPDVRQETYESDSKLFLLSINEDLNNVKINNRYVTYSCARIVPYNGRKYSNGYYLYMHNKILEMEKNDDKLRKRMMSLINGQESMEKNNLQGQNIIDLTNPPKKATNNVIEEIPSSSSYIDSTCDQSVLNQVFINPILKCLPNRKKLVAWLESSYKQYKERFDQGSVKISLDPPKFGKVALYPWDFILSRYRERKNFFLISKQSPFRIFMAVDTKNPFFENCMNINDIQPADLHKYPVTIKKLLTNATDLNDNFCILYGLSQCWALIGSVTKVNEQKESKGEHTQISDTDKNMSSDILPIFEVDESFKQAEHFDSFSNPSEDFELNDQHLSYHIISKEVNNDTELTTSDSSKWFVMTVENDFNELQFFKKGFFVKYVSIIKAINVARMSGKTVRLSTQKCVDHKGGPQFGIYAVPNINEYCVFVGPYEKHESLGLEIVKTVEVKTQNRTRGVWIITNKMDNIKVISNPLSFLPPRNLMYNEIISLESENLKLDNIKSGDKDRQTADEEIKEESENSPTKTPIPKGQPMKLVKPIKIRKTNGFYHLAPNGVFKPLSLLKSEARESQQQSLTPILLNKALTLSTDLTTMSSPLLNSSSTLLNKPSNTSSLGLVIPDENKTISISKRPIAEIAPQVKQFINAESQGSESKRPEIGMFVLKPEEINKRLVESRILSDVESRFDNLSNISDIETFEETNMDIENFLATSKKCVAPRTDTYVISDDDEEDSNVSKLNLNKWKQIWIQCKNVNNLGWIPGRRNVENHLSFEFPGFKYTDFYAEEEALAKINQVLSRKVYIPKHINLKWEVIETEGELKTKTMLTMEHLGPNFVLTKRGLRHKLELLRSKSLLCKDLKLTLSNNKDITLENTDKTHGSESKLKEEKSEVLTDDEEILT